MQVINGNGIAWNNDIDFYTKVIDIDFYNNTNRRLHLGHVDDCNFTLLRLIMPKEYNNYIVVMRLKPNNSKTLTFEPKIINGEADGIRYFSITGDCTKKTSQGYIQFVVQCIDNDKIIVRATSNKIPYIIEETLETGDPSSFTPEETTILDELRNNIQMLENNLSNKADKATTLKEYGITDAVDLEEYYSDMESIDSKFATVNTQLSGKVDSSVYNQKIEEIEDDKADYVKNDNVNHCLDMGSIYKTVVQFGEEQLTAIVFSCHDNVDQHLSQLAFTENGKLLFRAKTGTSWNKNDPFILFGGGS